MDLSKLESVSKEKYLHLTTTGRKTGKPHTVEIWFAVSNGKIYLSHEGEYTDWMKNIVKNSRIGARIGELSIEGSVRILKEEPSKELGKEALYNKYYGPASKAVIDDWFEFSTIMEITPI